MRAQLAVSSLIVFGIILIGLGFTRLPYVLSYDETVVLQTSRLRTVEESELIVTSYTLEKLEKVETVISSTFQFTELIESTSTARRILAEIVNRTLDLHNALVVGPFPFEGFSALEVSWRSNGVVTIFLSLDGFENASFWMLLGRGVTGFAVMPFDKGSTVYLIVKAGGSPANFSLTAAATRLEKVVETRTLIFTTYQTTTSTKTTYATTEKTFTTTYTTLRPEFYVISRTTAVTETRYPDLSFMTVMGSFIVFVGILFMILLLRTFAKPVEKP